MSQNNTPQNQNQPTDETRQLPTNSETTETPRTKRKGLVIGAGAIAALLLAGGIGVGIAEIGDDDDDNQVRTVAAENQADDDADAGGNDTAGSDPDSFRDAAEQAVAEAGGTGASSVELEGDGHEVEVELDDGGSAEVHVAADGAMRVDTEDADRFDQQDPVLDLDTLEDVMDAALAASGDAGVSDGVVDSVSASDDRGVTYEVSVRGADGREVDVDLAEDLSVVTTELDD